MAKGPQGVLHWLLHLAAHSIADTRQEPTRGRAGPSTGREGRYHLQAYRDAALGLGLTADQSQHFGFNVTSVPAELAGKYTKTIAEPEAARQDY